MKKIFLFVTAACLAASAFAGNKEMAAPSRDAIKMESPSKKAVASRNFKTQAAFDRNALMPRQKNLLSTRAGEESEILVPTIFFRPTDDIMSFGMTQEGSGYNGIRFSSSYGNVDFINFSLGAGETKWYYSEVNDYDVVDNSIVFNYKDTNSSNLSVKSDVGIMAGPVLEGTLNGTTEEYDDNAGVYYLGATPSYYGYNEVGLTFYQNLYLANDEGDNGTTYYKYAYAPGANGFEASGAASSWYTQLERDYPDYSFSDLNIDNFTIFFPKTKSAYFMTSGWIWMNVSAKSATQLISYIYPVGEDGKISENPIAIGYAGIPEGDTVLPIFEYYALNEDGDETEDIIIIDSEVAVTIEGFNGNEAITLIAPACGYYPMNYDYYYDSVVNYGVNPMKATDLYATLSVKVDGNPTSVLMEDTGLYYFNDPKVDEDTVTASGYSQFTIDAVFPWIVSVNGEKSVTLPLTGGSVDVEVNALYYNINKMIEDGDYEVNCSDWINLKIGESVFETGNTTLTISLDPSDVNRTGVVEIKGLGLTYSLKVIQGEDTGVNAIIIDKNAEYFDLSGRRVANPEKGIYIKKTGNKAEKVLL